MPHLEDRLSCSRVTAHGGGACHRFSNLSVTSTVLSASSHTPQFSFVAPLFHQAISVTLCNKSSSATANKFKVRSEPLIGMRWFGADMHFTATMVPCCLHCLHEYVSMYVLMWTQFLFEDCLLLSYFTRIFLIRFIIWINCDQLTNMSTSGERASLVRNAAGQLF